MDTNKKSALDINSLVPIVLILIVLAIVITFGQSILSSFKTSTCSGSSVFDPARDICADCTSGFTYNLTPGNCFNSTNLSQNKIAYTTSNTFELNSTIASQQGLDNISQKQNMIALIVVVAVIIGILVSVLYVKSRNE